ncbi:hypothetical protein Tco_0981872, partial [Tanacetum coccineum]
ILEITRCGMLRDVASRRDLKKFLAASTFPDNVLWSSWESAWATRSLHQSAPHEVVEKYELASLSIVRNVGLM